MKRLYLFIIVLTLSLSVVAQPTLTKSFNQPILGEVNTKLICDSVGVVPKSSGVNQLWDFSNFILTSNVETSNYISTSAGGGASYTGSSFVESYGSTKFFMKATATQYEIVGIENPSFALNINGNTAIQFAWPVAMGYSKTDAFSGTAHANNLNGNVTGNIVSTAPGNGTLIIPGGNTFYGVLQVRIRITATASFLLGVTTVNLKAVDYTYYDATHKFPLLTVSYADVTGAYTSKAASIRVHDGIVGINDLNFDATFSIFPNPAKDNFNVSLNNIINAHCTIEILNSLGQTIQVHQLGNDKQISNNISVSNLTSGVYFVKTTLGDKVSVRKLIKE